MQTIDDLFAAALSERDDDSRWSAIEELQRRGSRDIFERAADLCRDGSTRARVTGAEVLAQLGGDTRPFRTDAWPVLQSMLADDESVVLAGALQALGQQGDERVVDNATRLAVHPEPNVRWAVASALAEWVHDERAVRLLVTLMRDDDSSVRDAATFAIGALSELDTPAIRSALFARLEDSEPSVAREAQLGLARRHDRRVIPAVVRSLEAKENELDEIVDEVTVPEMLPALMEAKQSIGENAALIRLIDQARARAEE
ncbi:MAG TPA: HEAT repeat domain-containing protein [Thermoanaerobaculia bacterium]